MSTYCTRCGARARPGQRFCESCGMRLPEARPAVGEFADKPRSTGLIPQTGGVGVGTHNRDLDLVLEETLKYAGREHCYVYRLPHSVLLENLKGTTEIVPIPHAGVARLSGGGNRLLIDGRPVDFAVPAGEHRRLFCLTRATFAGPNGEGAVANVATLAELSGELFRGKTTRSLAALERLVEEKREAGALGGHGARLVHRPKIVTSWHSDEDLEMVLERVMGAAREREEYCYVFRERDRIRVEDRRASTDVLVVPNRGEAWLSEDGERLVIDGRPVNAKLKLSSEKHRRVLCLTRASFAGLYGEPSTPNVTTPAHLADELFKGELVRSFAALDAFVEQSSKATSGSRRMVFEPGRVERECRPEDVDAVAEYVVEAARRRNEYCYVWRGTDRIFLEDLRGTTSIVPVSNAGEAHLTPRDGTLLINGRPANVPTSNDSDKTLLCLTKASFLGPYAEPTTSDVTTPHYLAEELFGGQTSRSEVELEMWVLQNGTKDWLARYDGRPIYRPEQVVRWWHKTTSRSCRQRS